MIVFFRHEQNCLVKVNEMLLCVFPVTFLLSIYFLMIPSFSANPFFTKHRLFFRNLSIGLGITFLFSLAVTLQNPYWTDNGAKVKLEGISQYLFITTIMAAFYQFLLVPMTFGLLHILRKHRKQKAYQKESV